MGYTHYWRHKEIDQGDWQRIKNGVKKVVPLVEETGVVLCGPWGENEMSLTDDKIAFNGSAIADLHYEGFILERKGRGFSFCKTGQRPYDLMVTAVLTIVRYYSDVVDVSSDGESKDWTEGHELAEKALGHAIRRVI